MPSLVALVPFGVLAAGPVVVAADAPAVPSTAVEWIVEDGSTLILRLVMDEGKPCGGELSVDPTRRIVRFEGIPGALGCKRVAEAPFADVKTVRTQRREAGFILELRKEKGGRLVLLPLPHFQWFQKQHAVKKGGSEVDQALALAGGATSAGPDGGDAFSFGGVTGGGASIATVERVDLPENVQADTQKAVDLVREAMGRQPAPAQMLREVLQGRPLDASLAELLEEPGAFASTPVRVRGRLQRETAGNGFRLDSEGASIGLEAEAQSRFTAAGAWVGQEVEIVGRLRRRTAPLPGQPPLAGGDNYLQVWDWIGPGAGTEEGKPVTLSALLAGMTDYEGDLVRVVGRFRGRNMFGDLPPRSQKSLADWVIKSERAAVWITGHKAGGEGWSLDLESTGQAEWLEVVGRPRVRDGVAYLRASTVTPVAPPPGGRVAPARRTLSSLPSAPPSVVFSLPLEGESVSAGARIVVQFDRAMDEESFKDRVRLREGAGGLISVRLAYDEFRRCVVISPVRPPRPGESLRLELLPGIVDADGVPLGPRRGRAPEGEVVDVLRYEPGGGP